MALPVAVGVGAVGAAYLASGWDSTLHAKNNVIVVLMKSVRFWRMLINSPVEKWRPLMDKLEKFQEANLVKAIRALGYETETVQVAVQGGEIDVHIHRPKESKEPNAKLPLIVWFHGGGMVLQSAQDPCLVENFPGLGILEHFNGRAVVASVEYRRAPEHVFPVGVEDCIAATQWLSSNAARFGADDSRLCVAGYSAGGYLTSNVQQAARDRGFPLSCAVLICPMTRRGATTKSFLENGHRSDLPSEAMIWFWSQYCPDPSHVTDPRCEPIRGIGAGNLSKCLVVTGRYDALRDEGVEYYEALRAADVNVDHIQVEGSHLGPACDTKNWASVLQRWSDMLGTHHAARL